MAELSRRQSHIEPGNVLPLGQRVGLHFWNLCISVLDHARPAAAPFAPSRWWAYVGLCAFMGFWVGVILFLL